MIRTNRTTKEESNMGQDLPKSVSAQILVDLFGLRLSAVSLGNHVGVDWSGKHRHTRGTDNRFSC